MSFDKEKDGGSGRKSRLLQDSNDQHQPRPAGRKKRPGSPEVGSALRSVYQQTIEENIPPEMLDLLGKLG